MKLGIGVTLAAALGAVWAGEAAWAADMAPHRAVYTMSLASSRGSGGVVAANGTMTYEFNDACDGWTVDNRTVLNMAYSEGAQVSTTWDFVTWEAKNGSRYRFHVRSSRDGELSEEIDGTAHVSGEDRAGEAKYLKPEAKSFRLPAGTVFPTEHTVKLIDAAQAGERMFSRVIFDGAGVEGPLEVSAVVGPAANQDSPSPGPASSLIAVPSWRVRMAFFPLTSREATPDYEVSARYYFNGIATEVLQQFGSFSLRGKLEKIEALPKPDC
ncbi:MAG: cell envelope integrity EipB family protein [Rhodospirillales bacterium]|nr:cell envelope integrity EipB family protein [Rhodospirillales bacterium]